MKQTISSLQPVLTHNALGITDTCIVWFQPKKGEETKSMHNEKRGNTGDSLLIVVLKPLIALKAQNTKLMDLGLQGFGGELLS